MQHRGAGTMQRTRTACHNGNGCTMDTRRLRYAMPQRTLASCGEAAEVAAETGRQVLRVRAHAWAQPQQQPGVGGQGAGAEWPSV